MVEGQTDKPEDLTERVKDTEEKLEGLEARLRADEARLEMDEKKLKEEDSKIYEMSRKRSRVQMGIKLALRRIVLVLSIAAAVYCAIEAREIVIEAKYNVNKDAARTIVDRFWAQLPDISLTTMKIVGVIVGAAVGFCGVWILYKIIEWLIFGCFSANKIRT